MRTTAAVEIMKPFCGRIVCPLEIHGGKAMLPVVSDLVKETDQNRFELTPLLFDDFVRFLFVQPDTGGPCHEKYTPSDRVAESLCHVAEMLTPEGSEEEDKSLWLLNRPVS
jgi:hypothetical protein